jgi:hypothetical protein
MTSAADRRLAKLEGGLPPRAAVLAWLVEAQQYPGLPEAVEAIVDLPIEAAPLSVISRQVEAETREAMKGQPREKVDAAVQRAVRDSLFLFCLVIQINTAAREMTTVEGLRAAAVFYRMGCLLGGPREKDLEPAEWIEHRKDQALAWDSWRAVVAALLATMLIEEDARTALEDRYLGGHPSLLGDTETAWSNFGEIVDALWSVAESDGAGTPTKDRLSLNDAEQLFDKRVEERVRTVADNARIAAFDRLGENLRALEILEARVRNGGRGAYAKSDRSDPTR